MNKTTTTAAKASEHAKETAAELNEHGTSMSVNQLLNGYVTALKSNPKLMYGQYVAAATIAQNLGMSNPNITTDAILQGLASGKSVSQTLQGLGLSATQAKAIFI